MSTRPLNVDTPDTLRLSSSVCPSTSISALMSRFPLKVETPVTERVPVVVRPLTKIPSFVVSIFFEPSK